MAKRSVMTVPLLLFSSLLHISHGQLEDLMGFMKIPDSVMNQVDEWTKPVGSEAAFQPVVSKHASCQKHMSSLMEFPCQKFFNQVAPRSPEPPSSVHQLRPGDIDVVAAIGDSLVAGDAALDDSPFSVFIQYRGVSWCVGGESDWRRYLTIPNILKQFNPNITGYSVGEGSYQSKNSRFNIAMPAALDDDALKQAQILVSRVRSDPNINFRKSWKFVTIFIGHNDLCSKACFNPEKHTALQHKKQLQKALDFLKKNMPRTYVSLVTIGDVTYSMKVQRSFMCKLMHPFLCACLHRGQAKDPVKWVGNLAREYARAEIELIESGRYSNDPEFAVELMPFTLFTHHLGYRSTPADMKSVWMTNKNLISPDCFHMSQAGSALMANMHWNNLLESNHIRSSSPPNKIFERFLCPTVNSPYLFTAENSALFRTQGSQLHSDFQELQMRTRNFLLPKYI
ncbi:phospholipase B1, membrane-associated-like [Neocloeon triangulifer]|uniref:phospholipase B1, membrane-associated-like n=1 Tax=Neocloeon triangulifer TaxID=2078957 RepID=UPI00286F7AF0|nr:phospholipase B1, membrane-associated-like [Neocloeon triangulifer]